MVSDNMWGFAFQDLFTTFFAMNTNKELAALFSRMAQVLELLGANRFRLNAYQRGVRTLEGMTQDVGDLADSIATLTAIDGIGKGLAEKIVEYVQTGEIAELSELTSQVPDGVLKMLDISGLGPKTVAMFWKDAGVLNVDDLKAKIESGELEKLPRMGKKKLENIRKSIEFAESAGDRARIGDAMVVATYFVDQLSSIAGVNRINYAGSLRRGKETIGDIDVLVACDDPDSLSETFRSLPPVTEVLAAGATKSSVRTESGMQVDLRVVPLEQYGAALAYFTGSKEHNVAMRERAIKQGLRLNEYGLWRKEADQDVCVAAETEEAIYEALGIAFVPPELRESRGEFQAAQTKSVPALVDIADIKAELHAHTTASDGTLSIVELAEQAKSRGFHTVAVTDHSASSAIANGLDIDRLLKHIEAVHAANESVADITILAGSEVDILADGSLDYPDEILAKLDIVVASPHIALTQDPDKATSRLLAAINNPYVHILGHPTGRIIGQREGLSPDMSRIIQAAADTDTALEINCHHSRLDLRDTHVRATVEANVKISINTDAHRPQDFDHLIYGVLTARRGWARADDVVNCMSHDALHTWLKSKR